MRFLFLIFLLIPAIGFSQVGGNSSFGGLDLTTNARAAALGGTTISLADGDISQYFENPATLDSVRAQDLFFNINPYFADIIVFNGAYAFNTNKLGMFTAGLNYISYGSFEAYDETGMQTGEFNAQDYSVVLGKSHQLGSFTLGANLKLTHSSIDVYGSTAILADVGGIFRVNKNWTIGMVLSNLGGRISKYTDFVNQPIPFDVKVGTSFKPQYMPIRFTVTSVNLVEANEVESSGDSGRSNDVVDGIFRRINFGAELLVSKHFQLLVGYNHKRKQELKLEDTGGGAGFSYGLMAKVNRFQLRFSRATFHTAGGSSFISIQTNLNDFKSIL